MSVRLSAALLAGGQSRRMGRDKAFLEIDGAPLWRRQLATLRELDPDEILIAGPPRTAWADAGFKIVADAMGNAGPLAGLVAALRNCSAPLLVLLAVDLPHMRSDFLRRLLAASTPEIGVLPKGTDRFEPLAAVYPGRALDLAESQLRAGSFALQDFARAAVAAKLVREFPLQPADRPLFFNLNTPNDLSLIA